MTRRLLFTYLTITALTLIIVVIPLGITFATRERDRLVFDVERDAQAVANQSEDALEDGLELDLEDFLAPYDVPDARILVVDAAGISVWDTSDAALNRDYSTRPEIAAALNGERVTGRRWSETLDKTLVYVAIPVASNGVVHGAVRITLPSSAVDDRVQDTWVRLGLLSIIVLAIVGSVGLLLARGVTRPVRQVEDAARRLADGDLDARAGTVDGPPELTALAAQFDATAERLGQMVEAQRQFVGDASHQLRTPLTALRLRLETLHPSPEDEPKVQAALAETDRLSRLVQSLLVIARSESAQAPITSVDLADVVRDRAETWSDVAARNDVTIACAGLDELWANAVDGGVEQMLDNVLSNALAVSPTGSRVTITTSVYEEQWGRIVVQDDGPGMSEDERAQATARFWRPVGATTSGSGLGLAIVDHLALASGGQLSLEAGEGATGLRVVIDLPRRPGAP